MAEESLTELLLAGMKAVFQRAEMSPSRSSLKPSLEDKESA